MKEVTEDLIEKYVGFPDSLKEDVRGFVEAKIATDRAVQKIAAFYREYYSQLRGASRPTPDVGPPPSRSGAVVTRNGHARPSKKD